MEEIKMTYKIGDMIPNNVGETEVVLINIDITKDGYQITYWGERMDWALLVEGTNVRE